MSFGDTDLDKQYVMTSRDINFKNSLCAVQTTFCTIILKHVSVTIQKKLEASLSLPQGKHFLQRYHLVVINYAAAVITSLDRLP